MAVQPELVDSVIQHESGGDPNAVSPKGATGLMQIMPAVAQDYGVDPKTLTDPNVNRKLGTQYLGDLVDRYGGDERRALIAYNQGPNRPDVLPAAANYADSVLRGAGAPGPNPNPDSTYLAAAQNRQDVADVRQVINQVESAPTPAERAKLLVDNGISDTDYFKAKARFAPDMLRPDEAKQIGVTPEALAAYTNRQAQNVEGVGGGQTTAVPFGQDPVTYIPGIVSAGMEAAAGAIGAEAGTGAAVGAGIKGATTAGVAGAGIGTAQQETQALLDRHFQGHPGLKAALATVLPVVGVLAGTAGVAGASNLVEQGKAAAADAANTNPAALDLLAKQHGFDSGSMMSNALEQSKLTPLELLSQGAKGNVSLDNVKYNFSGQTSIAPELQAQAQSKIQQALQIVGNRHPALFNALDEVRVGGRVPDTMIVPNASINNTDGKLTLWINPRTVDGSGISLEKGFGPQEETENLVTILEHEFTHVAQSKIQGLGLEKTLNSSYTDPGHKIAEEQAYSRQDDLRTILQDHRDLREKIAALPPEVRQIFDKASVPENTNPESGAAASPPAPIGAAASTEPPSTAAAAPVTLPASAAITPEIMGVPKSAGEIPHTLADMVAEAKATPFTPEQVSSIKLTGGEPGHELIQTPIDSMDMLRLHFYTSQKVQTALENARLAKEYGNTEAMNEFQANSKELADEILPKWKAANHQMGLGLRVLGDPASAETPAIKAVSEALDNSQGNMDRLVKSLASLPTPDERQALLEKATQTDWTAPGALYNLYVNSILSFNSVGKKLLSDAANIAWQVPARGLAEVGSRAAEMATGAPRGSVGVSPGETAATVKAIVDGFGDALGYAGKSFVNNKPAFEGDVGFIDNPMPPQNLGGPGTFWEHGNIGRALDLYGHLVSLPGRSIVAVDQFSKAMQYNMELRALAQRQAFQDAAGEGLTGVEHAARTNDLAQQYYEKPSDWMTSQAMEVAKTNTFQQDLEGSMAKADEFRRTNYATRTLMPFFKTPVNITLQGIRQSPLAALSPKAWATIGGGGPDAALAMSKIALGTAVLGYLANHVIKGNITGGIPANLDTANRDMWLKTHEPYSVRTGINPDGSTNWKSYQGAEPLSWLLGLTADLAPAISYAGRGDVDNMVNAAGMAFAREFSRQPMWGALHGLTSALDNYEKGRAGPSLTGMLGKTAAGFIPSTLANYAGEVDPIKRQLFTMGDEFRNRIPWLKKNGVASLDPFGEPVIVPPGFMYNEFPAYKSVTHGADPVADEMIRLHNAVGFSPPDIPHAIGGPSDNDSANSPPEKLYGAAVFDVDPKGNPVDERNQWNKFRAWPLAVKNPDGSEQQRPPKLKDFLGALIQTPEYKALSDVQQANLWHEQFSTYQTAAQGNLLAANPQIRLRQMLAYQNKAQAMAARGPATMPTLGAP